MKEIIDSIIESRFYIEYIDRKEKTRYENPRYIRYLNYRYLAYLKYIIPEKTREDILDNLEDELKANIKVEEIYNRYLIEKSNIDDYNFIENEIRHAKIYIHIDEENGILTVDDSELRNDHKLGIIRTKDQAFFNMGKDYIDYLIEKDISHLNNKFLESNHTTIVLPTFITKINDKYLENIIYLNIYDCGILSIKLLLADERENNLLRNDFISLGQEAFPRVEILKPNLKYTAEDFFDKNIFYDINIFDIADKYADILNYILGWANFKVDNTSSQLEFLAIKDNKKLTNKEIVTMLLNSNYDYLDSFKEEQLKKITEESMVIDRKRFYSYSNNIALVQYIEKEIFVEKNKKIEIDDNQYTSIAILNSSENSRIYELAVITKFFYYNLYNNLRTINIENFNIDKWNMLTLEKEKFENQYNESSIFQEKTTYRDFYKKVFEKLSIEDNYKYKVEEEIKRISNIVDREKVDFKQNSDYGKTLIGLISTFSTVILSMNTLPNIIKIIGKGLREEINIKWINDIGQVLMDKSVLISIVTTFCLVTIIMYVINKYYIIKKRTKL